MITPCQRWTNIRLLSGKLSEIEFERGKQLRHYVYSIYMYVLLWCVCCILKLLIQNGAQISLLFYLLRIFCWWSNNSHIIRHKYDFVIFIRFPMFLWLIQLEKAFWLQYENLYVKDLNHSYPKPAAKSNDPTTPVRVRWPEDNFSKEEKLNFHWMNL